MLNRGDLTVYDDEPHACYHVMMGHEEWSSVPYPWGEAARDDLRRRAWVCHNDQHEAEALKQKTEYDEMMAGSERDENNLLRDIAKSVADWGTRDHDYYVMPGDTDK
jgi:hypothetical protein